MVWQWGGTHLDHVECIFLPHGASMHNTRLGHVVHLNNKKIMKKHCGLIVLARG
jgi:hypothetical protein